MIRPGLNGRGPLQDPSCLPWLARVLAHEPRSAAEALERGEPSVTELERFAAAHHLGPLLWPRTDDAELRSSLPDTLRRSWRADYMRRWIVNQSLLHELRGVRRAFFEAEMDFQLLKGPHLAERFYGDLAQRTFDDIDLLVRPEQAEPCLRVLRELGFYEPTPRYPLPFGLSPWLRRLTHATSIRRGALIVDLHWALRSHPSFAIDDTRLWATRQKFSLPGHQRAMIDVLADEYALVLTLLEIFDDLCRRLLPVKGLIDAFMILRSVDANMNWPAFLARRRAERLHRIVVDVLAMTVEMFLGRELLPELAAALANEGPADGLSVKLVLSRTNRVSVIGSYRLAMYEMPRPISLLHFLVSAPLRSILFRSRSARLR